MEHKINLPLSVMHNWVVVNEYNDAEIGKLLRTYYWDSRDVLRNEK